MNKATSPDNSAYSDNVSFGFVINVFLLTLGLQNPIHE